MTEVKADDLPEGSVVVVKAPNGEYDSSALLFTKNVRDRDYIWSDQHGSVYNDFMVQGYVDQRGATVLRHGYGDDNQS